MDREADTTPATLFVRPRLAAYVCPVLLWKMILVLFSKARPLFAKAPTVVRTCRLSDPLVLTNVRRQLYAVACLIPEHLFGSYVLSYLIRLIIDAWKSMLLAAGCILIMTLANLVLPVPARLCSTPLPSPVKLGKPVVVLI